VCGAETCQTPPDSTIDTPLFVITPSPQSTVAEKSLAGLLVLASVNSPTSWFVNGTVATLVRGPMLPARLIAASGTLKALSRVHVAPSLSVMVVTAR